MKVLMTLAGAGYGMQEQNIPNAERKKKKNSLCTSQRTGTADYLFVSRYSTEGT